MIIHAKGATPFTFWLHRARFAQLRGSFLFLEKAANPRTAKKAIEFERQDKKRVDSKEWDLHTGLYIHRWW
jgi:hypothetical protein